MIMKFRIEQSNIDEAERLIREGKSSRQSTSMCPTTLAIAETVSGLVDVGTYRRRRTARHHETQPSPLDRKVDGWQTCGACDFHRMERRSMVSVVPINK